MPPSSFNEPMVLTHHINKQLLKDIIFLTEIHAAAKETVALAEQRFLSNQHEWQFDNAWQEMLNHATNKVSTKKKRVKMKGLIGFFRFPSGYGS